jgi:hypothetical protein
VFSGRLLWLRYASVVVTLLSAGGRCRLPLAPDAGDHPPGAR